MLTAEDPSSSYGLSAAHHLSFLREKEKEGNMCNALQRSIIETYEIYKKEPKTLH